jgi:hypothetical protein
MIEKEIAKSRAIEKFHEDLINLCTSSVQTCGCQPIALSSVVAQGGVPAAKRYLAHKSIRSETFPLSEHGRIDLSVEALILRDEYRFLFEPNEIREAEKRVDLLKPSVPTHHFNFGK